MFLPISQQAKPFVKKQNNKKQCANNANGLRFFDFFFNFNVVVVFVNDS